MAQSFPISSKMRLIFHGGSDEEGNLILKPKTYQNVNRLATPDQVYQAAHALAGLSQNGLYMIERHDTSEIYE